MKLIIDIPDHLYNIIRSHECTTKSMLTKAIENGIPLDDLRAELGRCKTCHEMQLSENDTKGKLMISDIFCHIIAIIDGYTTVKIESEEA